MGEAKQDGFFGGQLRLWQPLKGHRLGTDAVLLAASTPPGALAICDLGAGVGGVGLRAAQLNPAASVVLVENNPGALALAHRNVADNGLSGRVDLRDADVLAKNFAAEGSDLAGAFDCVLSNPPFGRAAAVRASPEEYRAAAHILAGSLESWLRAAVRLLSAHGTLVMIHRADCIAEILPALDRRFGNVRLCFIHPRQQTMATRVLVRAVKGARGPLAVVSPLMLHEDDGAFTQQADAIHRGLASVRFD